MSQVQLPSDARAKAERSAFAFSTLAHGLQALITFAFGIATAWVAGFAKFTDHDVWQMAVIAAAGISLGFGAAYLFQHLRLNARGAELEEEFAQASQRLDALKADYGDLKRRITSPRADRSQQ